MTVSRLRQYINTDASDSVLLDHLAAAESLIRAHTHNRFQRRDYSSDAYVEGGALVVTQNYFAVGDTLEVYDAPSGNGLVVVTGANGNRLTVDRQIYDCPRCKVVLIYYPADVLQGAAKMIHYSLKTDAKAGVKSETISRHHIEYIDPNENAQSSAGVPASMLSFLRPYMCARFGQGVGGQR